MLMKSCRLATFQLSSKDDYLRSTHKHDQRQATLGYTLFYFLPEYPNAKHYNNGNRYTCIPFKNKKFKINITHFSPHI